MCMNICLSLINLNAGSGSTAFCRNRKAINAENRYWGGHSAFRAHACERAAGARVGGGEVSLAGANNTCGSADEMLEMRSAIRAI